MDYLSAFEFESSCDALDVFLFNIEKNWSGHIFLLEIYKQNNFSICILTSVVSWNPVHGKVYSIQNFVIKFVSDL